MSMMSPGYIGGEVFDEGIKADVKECLGWFPQRHFHQLPSKILSAFQEVSQGIASHKLLCER